MVIVILVCDFQFIQTVLDSQATSIDGQETNVITDYILKVSIVYHGVHMQQVHFPESHE